jgi:hypothetical protein
MSVYRTMKPIEAPAPTWWQEQVAFAANAVTNGIRRVAAYEDRLHDSMNALEFTARSRKPRCPVCGCLVERFVVVRQPGDRQMRTNAQCCKRAWTRVVTAVEALAANRLGMLHAFMWAPPIPVRR